MRVADYIFKFLADNGVDTCYYLAGGQAMYLNDALAIQDRIKPVAMFHEQACGIASIGHNTYCNSLRSIVLVTGGPGGTNLITPVTAAWIDSVPLLVISGQVPTHMISRGEERQRGPQEVNIMDIVKPITKGQYQPVPKTINKLKDSLLGIYEYALQHPAGPVWLDVPLDVQSAII